ncbi:MAG: hypothetical protein M1298_01090, partial [Chloroflexi bacterium]|nr:hypothetical protein [Chloroflexota bacterium]
MPALPRPSFRRSQPVQKPLSADTSTPTPTRSPKPPSQAATDRAEVSSETQPPKRRTLIDRLFPVRPDMPEPPWSRVIGLIITMAVIWEIIWFFTYYFTGPTAHNLSKTLLAVGQFFPLALLFSALGSIPGFWVMKRRVRVARAQREAEEAHKRALAHLKPLSQPASSR